MQINNNESKTQQIYPKHSLIIKYELKAVCYSWFVQQFVKSPSLQIVIL